MTPEQIALVQDSFKAVVPIAPQAADIFYGRLFEVSPELRPMFPEDLKEQKVKLMAMLGVAVNNLHKIGEIVGAVQDLGRRHVAYGVEDAHYDLVGAALLHTLDQGLQDAFTPDVEKAWAAAYGLLASTMKDAAAVEAA